MTHKTTQPLPKGSYMTSIAGQDCFIWTAPKTVYAVQYLTATQSDLLAHALRLAVTGTAKEDIYPTLCAGNDFMPLAAICQCGRNCVDCTTADTANAWLVNLLRDAFDEFRLWNVSSVTYAAATLGTLDTQTLQLTLRNDE